MTTTADGLLWKLLLSPRADEDLDRLIEEIAERRNQATRAIRKFSKPSRYDVTAHFTDTQTLAAIQALRRLYVTHPELRDHINCITSRALATLSAVMLDQ